MNRFAKQFAGWLVAGMTAVGSFFCIAAFASYGSADADPSISSPSSEQATTTELVRLWEPLDEAVTIPIGRFAFAVPRGATAVEMVAGPAAVDSNTGQLIEGPVEHPRIWMLSRGQSLVKVDSASGEILHAEINPVDIVDFERILHPVPLNVEVPR